MTLESIALSLSMATAAGLMGCFVVMRRMTLAADALSHIALPGIGAALILHFHPVTGAVGTLLLGAAVIWIAEQRALLATETVIGVVFSAALALGSLMASGEDLVDALLGAPGSLSPVETAAGVAAALGVVAFVVARRRRLLVTLVSRDIAVSAGIGVRRLELEFLVAFAVTVALGIRYLGVLLMGSLVIIPAATAKRVARDLRQMLAVSVGVALVSTVVGTALATALGWESGPPIVLTATACFVLGLIPASR